MVNKKTEEQSAEKSGYVSYEMITPGQARYSSRHVQEKIAKHSRRGVARWDPLEGIWRFAYNTGTSIFAPESPFPVVNSYRGYVLTDGHHDVLASIELGAKTIPVKITEDKSDLAPEEFWAQAEREGLVYRRSLEGNYIVPPISFRELVDDPNRYFAALIARKVLRLEDIAKRSSGAEYPVWIKIGRSVPFIEFALADLFYKRNILYSYSMGPAQYNELAEQARKLLAQEPVPGLLLVPERYHYTRVSKEQVQQS